MDASEAVDGFSRSAYDPDELKSEDMFREMVQRLNRLFRNFVRSVSAAVSAVCSATLNRQCIAYGPCAVCHGVCRWRLWLRKTRTPV